VEEESLEQTIGSRVTSEEKATISTYIGVGLAVLLIVGALYFFFFARTKIKEVSGFDPNRPMPSDASLRSRLSNEAYHVVRENGTETAFKNKLWDKFEPGIYVDVITGQPLFSSVDKFDSGTGRPCFSKPLSAELLTEQMDNTNRVEIRAKLSNAHLGHVFQDTTTPTGKRYAVNSAALKFIPTGEMEREGYGSYMSAVTPVTQK
jgi:peptide methionine sulfoxide reductase msrA/msrB